MYTNFISTRFLTGLALLVSLLVAASCATSPPPCSGVQTKNLGSAISDARQSLSGGCEAHFDRYFDDLLTIAE